MTDRLHKLKALRVLNELMGGLEKKSQQRIELGENPANVNRETAQMALTIVIAFFQDYGIAAKPLIPLLRELTALSAGSAHSDMLAPAATTGRRRDAPFVEMMKGRLAAIMEFVQQTGLDRKAAGDWVIRHIPSELKGQLGVSTRAAVDKWLVNWGGRRGAISGSGRDGYLRMRALLQRRHPSQQELTKIVGILAQALAR